MEGYKDTQLKINFDEKKEEENKVEAYEIEQKEVADKFGILNYKELERKENGEWYMHNMKVEDYAELMSGKDSDDIYKPKNPLN